MRKYLPPADKPLNPRQELFAAAVAAGHPHGAAATLSGFAQPAYGVQLMADPRIQQRVREERAITSERIRAQVVDLAGLAVEVMAEQLRTEREGRFAAEVARVIGLPAIMAAGAESEAAQRTGSAADWQSTVEEMLDRFEAMPEARALLAEQLADGAL